MVNTKKSFTGIHPFAALKGILAFFLLFAIYQTFRTHLHLSYAQDSLIYSFWVENGIVTKLNRHLLWSLLYFRFFNFWEMLAPGMTGLRAGQLLSGFFGAGGVAVFYLLAKEFLRNKQERVLPLIFTGFYAFSFAYWHFSAEACPQIFSVLLRSLLLLCILKEREAVSLFKVFIWGILFGIVLLADIMSIYFFPSFIFFVCFFSKQRLPLKSFVFIASAMCFLLIFYGLMTVNILGYEISEIFLSFFYRAPGNPLSLENLKAFAYLLSTIVFIPGLRSPSTGNPEIIDFGHIFAPVPVVLILFFAVTVILAFRRAGKFLKEEKALIIGALVWSIPFFIIQATREFRAVVNFLHLLLPFWFFAFIVWNNISETSSSKFPIKPGFFLLLAAFVGHNFSGIYPNSKIENSEMYDCYRYIKDASLPGDQIVLMSNGGNYELYQIRYLLRGERRPGYDPLILDGNPHRGEPKIDRGRYERYGVKIDRSGKNNFLLVIVPGLQRLPKIKGNPEVLSPFLTEIYRDTNQETKNHKLALIEEIASKSGEYEILENDSLNCHLIRMKIFAEKQENMR